MNVSTLMRRITTTLCLLLMSATIAMAQSSGDKLYNQGLQLQKTMTVKAQNSAIAKFSSAKNLYDSAAKKAQCDQAISVSRNIISSLKDHKDRKDRKDRNSSYNSHEIQHREQPTLSVSNTSFDNIGLEGSVINVTVATNQSDWSVAPVTNSDGSSYFTTKRTGDQTFEITVPRNPRSGDREQEILVSAGDLTRKIHVKQEGRKVRLSATEQVFKFKGKGGATKGKEIWSDSDVTYPDNNDANWHVTECPDWVKLSIETKAEKSGFFDKVLKGAKDVANKVTGGGEDEDSSIKKYRIIVQADPQVKGAPARTGSVTIESGNTTMIISVNQDAGK